MKKEFAPVKEGGEQQDKLFSVIREVMDSPDYFVGQELEYDQDFSNWAGSDFREIKGAWVLAEKFFEIPTVNSYLVMRITEADPQQYWVNTNKGRVGVSFVLDVMNSRSFRPVIFIGKDEKGEEQVLRRELDKIAVRTLPQPLQEIALDLGITQSSKVVQDIEGDRFAGFIKEVLAKKTVIPTWAKPPDQLVREELELGPDLEITEEHRLLAEMLVTEQELLGYACADMIISA